MSKELTPEILALMEIAKNPIKEDEFKKLPPAKRFMCSEGIEAGNYAIPAMLVYDRYIRWADAYKIKPLSVVNFFKEFALYADKKSTSQGNYYMLNPKGFDLSPQYLELVRTRKWNSGATEKKKTQRKHKD